MLGFADGCMDHLAPVSTLARNSRLLLFKPVSGVWIGVVS